MILKILNFVKSLSKFCVFYHSESKELSLFELLELIKTTLNNPTIDLFCSNKN